MLAEKVGARRTCSEDLRFCGCLTLIVAPGIAQDVEVVARRGQGDTHYRACCLRATNSGRQRGSSEGGGARPDRGGWEVGVRQAAKDMADSAAPAPAPSAREKPAFDKSMSARSSFKKKFVSAHAVLPFDQPMLIYHGGSIAVWLLLAFVLPLMRWMADDDRGFHSAFVWAMACLIVALFYVCE